MQMRKYAYTLVMLFVVSGCAQFGLEKPTTFAEEVAYVEATAQGAIKMVQGLTCTKYTTAGACVEPGRPLHPTRGKEYVQKLGDARKAAKAAGAMPMSGGDCLGRQSTPTACLALANALLTEVQGVLEKLQPKK
jgi:hypothetical protein